jgi:hypothetical protein
MARELGIATRNAFQRNHFLLVDASKDTQSVGVHQYRALVDESHAIRTVGENELSEAARVEDLSGLGYCTIPRLYAVKAHGLVDVQKVDGFMHRFAGLCAATMQRSDPVHAARWKELLGTRMAESFGPISASEALEIAQSLPAAIRDSALAMEMADGAVHVTAAEIGAQIFVELEGSDPERTPQIAFEDNMYACQGSGPVHLIGGIQALVVSRAPVSFSAGIKEDNLAQSYKGSGLPADAIEEMRMRVTLEDGSAVFLQQGVPVDSLPIPEHGVLMRAMAGGVGVWDGDRLIHLLKADNGTSLLCHPDSGAVQLRASTHEAQLLKIPFKLN